MSLALPWTANLPYDVTGFGDLDGSGFLRVSWAELLLHAVTVGYGPRNRDALASLETRVAITRSSLRIQHDAWVARPSFFRLDSSEMSVASFYLGMTQVSLTTASLLGLPALTHVSTYMAEQGIRRTKGKRADFVALSFSDGSSSVEALVEAKGRADETSVGAALAHAKDQLKESTISAPVSVASVAFFNERGEWAAIVNDPPTEGNETPEPSEVAFSHYAPIVRAMLLTNQLLDPANDGRVSVAFPEFGLELSLPAVLFRSIVSALNTGVTQIDPQVVVSAQQEEPSVRQRELIGRGLYALGGDMIGVEVDETLVVTDVQ